MKISQTETQILEYIKANGNFVAELITGKTQAGKREMNAARKLIAKGLVVKLDEYTDYSSGLNYTCVVIALKKEESKS